MEQETMNPRQKGELILNWARKHITNPCGETDEEKAFMRERYQGVVRKALEEPGVGEILTPDEKEEIQSLLQERG